MGVNVALSVNAAVAVAVTTIGVELEGGTVAVGRISTMFVIGSVGVIVLPLGGTVQEDMINRDATGRKNNLIFGFPI